jgi:hypothetical protein
MSIASDQNGRVGTAHLCDGGGGVEEVLGGAPVAASMKGSQQWHRRGPDTGAVAAAVKGSWHSGDDRVPAVAVMMGSQQRHRALLSLPIWWSDSGSVRGK